MRIFVNQGKLPPMLVLVTILLYRQQCWLGQSLGNKSIQFYLGFLLKKKIHIYIVASC